MHNSGSPFTINARQELDSALVKRFVPTEVYWRRFSAINEIIVGTGGSGKTAMLRMMDHKVFREFSKGNSKARRLLENKSFVGIYVPVGQYFGDSSLSQELTDAERQIFFTYSFNIMMCRALMMTIKSCIECYKPETLRPTESKIARTLGKTWFERDISADTFDELREVLAKDWLTIQHTIRRRVNYGEESVNFDLNFRDMALFSPVASIVENLVGSIGLSPDTIFLILIDEAHFLSDYQKVALNTLIRSSQVPFVFKIATEPYKYCIFETLVDGYRIRPNQDFQYVCVDDLYRENNSAVFKEIVQRLLGDEGVGEAIRDSLLKGPSTSYSSDAIRILGLRSENQLDQLFLSSLTPRRKDSALAERKRTGQSRDSKITKKYLPVFCTKKVWEKYSRISHHTKSYFYGFDLMVKISEENIRRFLRILNQLETSQDDSPPTLGKSFQNTAFDEYSDLEFEQTKNMSGSSSYGLLNRLCTEIEATFHYEGYTGDTCTAFRFRPEELEFYSHELANLVVDGRVVPKSYTSSDVASAGPVFRISFLMAIRRGVHPRWGEPLLMGKVRSESNSYSQLNLDI